MGTYLHRFNSKSEFDSSYNTNKYREPWVSLTTSEKSNDNIISLTISGSVYNFNFNNGEMTESDFTGHTYDGEYRYAYTDNNVYYFTNDEMIINSGQGILLDVNSENIWAKTLSFQDSNHEYTYLLVNSINYNQKKKIDYNKHITPVNIPQELLEQPLTFEFNDSGDFYWVTNNSGLTRTIEYKKNDGEWTSITSATGSSAPSISVVSGDTIQVRGNNTSYAHCTYTSNIYASINPNNEEKNRGTDSSIIAGYGGMPHYYYNYFSFNYEDNGNMNVYGNIMSLMDYNISFDDSLFPVFDSQSSDFPSYDLAFYGLFNNLSLIDASNLILPVTTLADSCYYNMFAGCTSLTTAPELPATTLAQACYSNMFSGCTSLTAAPELPSTTLAYGCYYGMFEGCTSLTTAPELPATTLAESCYFQMFGGCSSLTTAPELPATTLATNCYNGMFNSCTSLTTAPALPATTLANYCYSSMFYDCTGLTTAPDSIGNSSTVAASNSCYYMFNGCTSLTAAPELPATILGKNCYNSMFSDCTSLTTAPSIIPATILAQECCRTMFYRCNNLRNGPQSIGTSSSLLGMRCCEYMFSECTNLTTAPELPATTLESQCYKGMFKSCYSLTTAPELPATTLEQSCYYDMFNSCTGLTTAPELPATTLPSNCYYQMFYNCSSLNYIKCLATDISAYRCTYMWVNGVQTTAGTFVKDANMSSWTNGNNGIPTNWTVQDAS